MKKPRIIRCAGIPRLRWLDLQKEEEKEEEEQEEEEQEDR